MNNNTEKPCRVIGVRSYDVIMMSFLYFVPLSRDVYVFPLVYSARNVGVASVSATTF